MVAAGIDVSKAMLDVVGEGPVHRFANSGPGIRGFLRHMARAGATQAVCEATGGYERLLVSRLRAAGIIVQVAHPLRVRACGYEAKTDALDARVLARYDQVFPASAPCPSESEEEREELQQLLRRCRQWVAQRVQERNRLDKGVSPVVGQSTRRHLTWLDQEIARLDQAYQILLQGSATLRPQVTLYRSVPGVGSLTAAMLVAFLLAWGQRDSKDLTSLVGLAPWSRDSGHKRGQRSIRGRRAPRPVHGSPVRDSTGRHPPTLPSGPAVTRQNGQGRPGGGHAQTPPAPERGGSPRDPLVATGEVTIGIFHSLTDNTDTVLKVKSRQPWACGLDVKGPGPGRRR